MESKKGKKCPDCDNPLRKFTVTADWNGREYHKKCYTMIMTNLQAFDLAISTALTEKDKQMYLEDKQKYLDKLKK